MFKENSTEKLIEYIQTLPEKEQNAIAQTLSNFKTQKDKKKGKEDRLGKVKRFQKFVGKHQLNVPNDFKFDREEANER